MEKLDISTYKFTKDTIIIDDKVEIPLLALSKLIIRYGDFDNTDESQGADFVKSLEQTLWIMNSISYDEQFNIEYPSTDIVK